MNSIGLEWRDRVLTVVRVERGKDGLEVHWSQESFAPGEAIDAERVAGALAMAGVAGGKAVLAVCGRSIPIKPIPLPPVDEPSRIAILAEDGERFFLLPRGPRAYGLLSGADAEIPWVAAAPAEEIEELVAGCRAASLHVETITASVSVYPKLSALFAGTDGAPDGTSFVVRVTPDLVEWVGYREGRIAEHGVSSPSEGPDLRRRIESRLGAEGRASLLSDDAAAEWTGDGPFHRLELDGVRSAGSVAGALGAALVDASADPLADLTPPRTRAEMRSRSRRLTRALAAAAGILAVVFVALLLGERRERRARMEEAIRLAREEAAPVLAARAELDRISQAAVDFHTVQSEQMDHLEVLRVVSEALPRNAWIAAWESRSGEEVLVSGYAVSATDVVTALTRAPGLANVRFAQQSAKVDVGNRRWESFSLAVEVE